MEPHEVCFHYGMVGLIKALSGFALLIPDQLGPWLDGDAHCAVDSSGSGVPDQAEASACALLVGLDQRPAGACPMRENIHWERPTGGVSQVFQLDHAVVAEAVPIAFEFTANGACSTGSQTQRYLHPADSSLVLTVGLCQVTHVAARCDTETADCAPCPVLHPDGGALDVYEGIVKGLNDDVEILFHVLAASEGRNLRTEVHAFRAAVCATVDDETDACAVDDNGIPRIDTNALASYLLTEALNR